MAHLIGVHSVPLLCPEVCRPRGWVGRYLLTGYTTYIPTIPTPHTPAPLFQEPLFAARVIYDLLFFFMVIIIVLNLIFGVIIDTFADLRSEKQKKEEILKTTCFICGEWAFAGGLGWGGRDPFSRVPVLASLWASCSVLLGNIWSAAS